jgi:hypothetical protein
VAKANLQKAKVKEVPETSVVTIKEVGDLKAGQTTGSHSMRMVTIKVISPTTNGEIRTDKTIRKDLKVQESLETKRESSKATGVTTSGQKEKEKGHGTLEKEKDTCPISMMVSGVTNGVSGTGTTMVARMIRVRIKIRTLREGLLFKIRVIRTADQLVQVRTLTTQEGLDQSREELRALH